MMEQALVPKNSRIKLLIWIMDTGASHHLTGKIHILTDVRRMELVLVIMADGREKISDKEGTVVFGLKLVLKSVFYVEELSLI